MLPVGGGSLLLCLSTCWAPSFGLEERGENKVKMRLSKSTWSEAVEGTLNERAKWSCCSHHEGNSQALPSQPQPYLGVPAPEAAWTLPCPRAPSSSIAGPVEGEQGHIQRQESLPPALGPSMQADTGPSQQGASGSPSCFCTLTAATEPDPMQRSKSESTATDR